MKRLLPIIVLILGLPTCAIAGGLKAQDDGSALALTLAIFASWSVIGVVLGLSVSALATLFAMVAPHLTIRASERLATRRRSAFWLGFVTLLIFLVLVTGFVGLQQGGAGVFGLLNLILILGYAIVWFIGFSGVAHYVGSNLITSRSVGVPGTTVTGALVLMLSFAVPLIGFVLSFYVTCLSIGVFPYAWFGTSQEELSGTWATDKAINESMSQ